MTPAELAASVPLPEPQYPGARIAGKPNRVYLESELIRHATAVAAAAVAADSADAERYRCLVAAALSGSIGLGDGGWISAGESKAAWDAYLDAAIRARSAEQEKPC